jgi:anaerobic selenocysteine-containing dehydrogenase
MDLQLSYWHDWVQINNPAIPPVGESQSNHWLISALAKRLGYREPCFQQSEEEVIREALQGTGLDFDALRRGPVLWNDLSRTSFDDGHFPTPTGKIPLDGLPRTQVSASAHPYRFITPKTFRLQGSQYGNMPEKLGDLASPKIFIHPDDAAREGISQGQTVRAWNERGEVTLTAAISDRTQTGLLVSYMVVWGANANATTPDTPADLGGNSTFHSNQVSLSVDRVRGAPTTQ